MNLQVEGKKQVTRPLPLFPQEKQTFYTSLPDPLKVSSGLEQTPHRTQPRGALPLGKAWPHSLLPEGWGRSQVVGET